MYHIIDALRLLLPLFSGYDPSIKNAADSLQICCIQQYPRTCRAEYLYEHKTISSLSTGQPADPHQIETTGSVPPHPRLHRLFGRFARFDNAFPHFGIGLNIRQFIIIHNAQIAVTERFGNG